MPGEIRLGRNEPLGLKPPAERKALAEALLKLSSEYGWRAMMETIDILWGWRDDYIRTYDDGDPDLVWVWYPGEEDSARYPRCKLASIIEGRQVRYGPRPDDGS